MNLVRFSLVWMVICLVSGSQASAQETRVKASLSEDRMSVRVVNAVSGEFMYELIHNDLNHPDWKGKIWKIWSVAVSSDGKYIATGGRDTTCRLWDAQTGKLIRVLTAQKGYGDISNHEHEGGYIWSVAFSPDNRLVATGGYNGQIRVWDIKTQRLLEDVGKFGGTQNPPGVVVRFAENGRSIIAKETSGGTKEFVLDKRLWPGGESSTQPSENKELAQAVAVVMLARGQTKDFQLCWDDGNGRGPVVFLLGSNDKLSEDQLKNFKGEPRYERGGVVVEIDEKKSTVMVESFAKDGKFIGKGKHLSSVAVSVSAHKDASFGVQPVFVRVVSGTGRHMHLLGEFRVIVYE